MSKGQLTRLRKCLAVSVGGLGRQYFKFCLCGQRCVVYQGLRLHSAVELACEEIVRVSVTSSASILEYCLALVIQGK